MRVPLPDEPLRPTPGPAGDRAGHVGVSVDPCRDAGDARPGHDRDRSWPGGDDGSRISCGSSRKIYPASVPGLPGRGEVIVHGDFGPQNVLIDDGHISALAGLGVRTRRTRHRGSRRAEWILRMHHPRHADDLPELLPGRTTPPAVEGSPGSDGHQMPRLLRTAEQAGSADGISTVAAATSHHREMDRVTCRGEMAVPDAVGRGGSAGLRGPRARCHPATHACPTGGAMRTSRNASSPCATRRSDPSPAAPPRRRPPKSSARSTRRPSRDRSPRPRPRQAAPRPRAARLRVGARPDPAGAGGGARHGASTGRSPPSTSARPRARTSGLPGTSRSARRTRAVRWRRRGWVRASGGLLDGRLAPDAVRAVELVEDTGVARAHRGVPRGAPGPVGRQVHAAPRAGRRQHQLAPGRRVPRAGVRSLNLWLALSPCGVDAPGLDIVPRRFDEILPTGTEGAMFDWSVSPGRRGRRRRARRDRAAPSSSPATRCSSTTCSCTAPASRPA